MNHKLFILAPFALFFLTSCGSEPTVQLPHVKTAIVSTGTLLESDRIITPIEGKHTADLAFKASGRIATMLVSPGDSVKAGQILATLGNEEGNISRDGLSRILSDLGQMHLDIASIGSDTKRIHSSLEDLYTARLESADQDIRKAQIGVELANKDRDLAVSNLENSVSIFSGSLLSASERIVEAEKNLSTAQNTLVNTKQSLVSQEATIRKNALSAMANAFVIARNARDFSDELLGVTDANRTKNDGYEAYLAVKNTTIKTDAERTFARVNSEYESMYTWYYANIVGKEISAQTLDAALSGSLATLTDLRELLHANASVLENSITSTAFPDSQLAGLKTKNTELLSSLESVILSADGGGVKGSINVLDMLRATSTLTLGQLTDAVKVAEERVNLAKTGKDTSGSDIRKNMEALRMAVKMKEDAISLAQASVEQAQKARSVLASERVSKLAEIDAKLAELSSKQSELSSKDSEVRMNRDLAQNTIESGIIRAPYDGVVLAKRAEVGSVVSGGMPILSITSTDMKYVKLRYDPILTSLSLGDSISVRSIGSGVTCAGLVTLVNPHPDATHNKWYLEAELRACPSIVGTRMEALLTRSEAVTGSGVVIPLSAISSKYSEPGVYVIENNIAHFQLIRIIRSDATSALVEWLPPGARIVTEGKENVADGERVE